MTCEPSSPFPHDLGPVVDVVAGIVGGAPLLATLSAMADALREVLPCDGLALHEVDVPRRCLVAVCAAGPEADTVLRGRPPLDALPWGRSLLRRAPAGLAAATTPDSTWLLTGESRGPVHVSPLLSGDTLAGCVSAWRTPGVPFTSGEADLLRRFAALAAVVRDHAVLGERLQRQALVDEETGLFNRRYFLDRLTAEIARGQRHDGNVGLVLLALDGHTSGDDAAVCAFATALRAQTRIADILCRVDPTHLAIVLPNADAREATIAANRLLRAAGDRFAASAGVASGPADGTTAAGLLEQAAARLGAARRAEHLRAA